MPSQEPISAGQIKPESCREPQTSSPFQQRNVSLQPPRKSVEGYNKDGLARHKDADLVDVTMILVDAFNPSERQRKGAIAIQEHKPISLEQAERIKD